MGEAYTPGLKVADRMMIRKERRLPLKGEVMVSSGMTVSADTVVARTHLPGQVELVNIANSLGIDPKEVKRALLKSEGEKVQSGEILARTSGLFGLFKSECPSPISGTLEAVSDSTGKATLRRDPALVSMKAFVDGEVESVIPEEGVVLRCWGSYVQGIFGIGGETWGPLRVMVSSRQDDLDESRLGENCAGAIVVGGRYVTLGALKKAVKLGVRGVVVGGIDDEDLKEFLGYDLGVAITGREEKGLTLLITEGFGKIAMAEKTFRLLKNSEGRQVSMDGRTQIRAGVIRPELIVPHPQEKDAAVSEKEIQAQSRGLSIGSQVRIIREPYFGRLAKVSALPPEPQIIETEARTRVVEVVLEDGKTWVLPRANVELVGD